MSNVKIELDHDGIRDFLKYEMQDEVMNHAQAIAERYNGKGTAEVSFHVGKSRCNASVSVTQDDDIDLLIAMGG